MVRQSTRWLLSTAVSVCIANGVVYGAGNNSIEDGKAAGQSAGNLVLGTYGSKEGLNQNLLAPATGTGSQLTSLDGSKSFNGAISSPSSAKFLEVDIQPGGTGDLERVIVLQDTDSDGVVDNTFTLPMPVSGVCTNGIISCDPGTWANCNSFSWSSDANGVVTLVPGSITSLGGCYCINSSCGSNLSWSNSAIILKDLGGGVVNAIHKSNPALQITNVKSDITSITYYGSDPTKTNTAAGKITSLNSSPAVVDLTKFFGNPAALTTARDDLAMGQAGDPTSLYSLVTAAGNRAVTKTGTCSISRIASVKSETKSINNTGTGQVCTDHLVFMRILKVDEFNYKLELIDSGPGGLPGDAWRNCGYPGGDGYHLVRDVAIPPSTQTESNKLTTASFFISNISGPGCTPGAGFVDGIINGFGNPVQTTITCPSKGAQAPTYNFSYVFEYASDNLLENITDGCTAYANDSNCKLRNETINGVTVMRDYNPTGLNALGSCLTFHGLTREFQICREWWEKKREYVCTDGSAYDFSDIGKRYGKIKQTTENSGSGFDFIDYSKDKDGNWNLKPSGPLNLPNKDHYNVCENACKTRKPKEDTQVSLSGVISDNRTAGTADYDFFYRTCNNNVCPAEPGEEIITPCQCINEFAQAATIMQTLRVAGKDNICSSGTKSSMKNK